MYRCEDCGLEFNKPQKIKETKFNVLTDIYLACPECHSKCFHIKSLSHCRCCGAKLEETNEEFCSDECREKMLSLRKKQIRMKLICANSSLENLVLENEINNQRYGTDYSYGQFANLLYSLEKKKCNAKKKRKS